MPIVYNPQVGGWSAEDLTQEEKQSLINIATSVIVDALGEQLAHKVMQAAGTRLALQDTPREDMFEA